MTTKAKLKVEERTQVGNQARKIRRDGLLPAVVYGNKQEPVNVQLSKNDFIKLYREAGSTTVIELDLDGKKFSTLVQDMDIHPVSEDVRHVDFLVVDLKQKIVTEVPIEYVGEAKGAMLYDATLYTNLDVLQVEALPDKIPHEIKIDVEGLEELTDHIKVSDLEESPDYVIVNDPEEVIASLVSQKEEEEEEPVVEEGIEGFGGESSDEAGEGEKNEEKSE